MRDYQDGNSDLRFVVKEVNNTTERPDMLTLYFERPPPSCLWPASLCFQEDLVC